MIPPMSNLDPNPQPIRRRAPLNSVSTRIILCVFFSTMLTAMVVSWLSIGAIHNDVRSRVELRTRTLAEERRDEIQVWHSAASAQLAASAAIGTPWHADLLSSVANREDTIGRDLHWFSPNAERTADGSYASFLSDLPPPPKALARYFDHLRLRPSGNASGPALECFSTQIDLIEITTSVVAELEGCLSQATLLGSLDPSSSDLVGMRLLVADENGRIIHAAGIRANARLGTRLPMSQISYSHIGKLTDYDDADGNRLVGSMTPIARTGWILAVETESARAFAPAIAITNQIFIVDVCIILLFSVLAYNITLAIMQPIEALAHGAQRIAEGQVNYQIPLPANNDDELGLLTRAFNEMMEKLRNSQLEIEQDRFRLAEKNEELQRANEILGQLSITDGLTKLHNHRYFQDHLTREIKRASRTKQPLSLILLDIDDFKLLNDTHGHAAGDEVLTSLAAIMNDSARESDLIARYGGEEFVILMPNTDLAGGVHLAEKIRMAVESTRLIIGDGMKPVEITISLGVALYDGNRREFFSEADRALYQAKAAGKNCVIIANSENADAG
jgi:diguanylate cyclase (GGDEF)-like protein